MNLYDPILSAGLVNLGLLALAAIWATRRDLRWAWLAAALSLSLVVLAAIVVQHRTEGQLERVAVAVEQAAWAIGPLVLIFVRRAVGGAASRRFIALHMAAPTAIVVLGSPLLLLGAAEPLPPLTLILWQAVYAIAAAIYFARRPLPRGRSMLGFWWPIGIVAALMGIHAGQLLRLGGAAQGDADMVPIAGSIIALVLLFAGLALGGAFARPAARYGKSALTAAEASALFERVRRMLVESGAYRRADLSLEEVAGDAGVPPYHVSQALSEGGASFSALLATLRVEEAKRLLLEPENRKVALEPIGMEAGFRSRSVFYASFRKQVGLTPAQFRAHGASFLS